MTEGGCFSNSLLLAQVTGYIVVLIFSLCTLVPTILHLVDFKGHCLLFTNGTWDPQTGQFIANWASQFYCDYNILWSTASIGVAITQIFCIFRNIRRNVEKEFLSVLCELLVCVVFCLIAMSGALLTTMGYQRWCDAIMLRFETCESAASETVDIDKKDGIYTGYYYMHFGIVQFGACLCFAMWVGLALCSLLVFCSQHQDYVIRVSMARERARLVGDRRTVDT